MAQDSVIRWLLEGDPAIRWQTLQDLLNRSARTVSEERRRVAEAGWGARLLARQDPSGLWAGGLYSPKWTSTTYTLLLLRSFGLPPGNAQAQKGCRLLLDHGVYRDGGINLWTSYKWTHSETCVSGMVLSLAAYFLPDDERVNVLAGHLLREQMRDGGWNCQTYRGATHGSFHTTILALEGLRDYEKLGAKLAAEARDAQRRAREFLLVHRLFRSHHTGEVVKPAMTRFSFPPRWHYDVLRGLDYFQECRVERDERLGEAIGLVETRRKPDGCWVLQNRYPGRTFFELETPSQPSRWNTLRALRVLRWWGA
jgi:hypothetical protein